MVYKSVVIVVLLFFMFSCIEDKQATHQMRIAESIMDNSPDSAFSVLSDLRERKGHLSRSQRMRLELLYAESMNKAGVHLDNDSVLLDVVKYYDTYGDANERVLARYLLGRTYHDLGEIPEALQTYLEALESVDTLDADCNYDVLTSVLGQMADVFHHQYLAEEELRALKQCEEMAIKAKDSFSATKAYELRVRAYYLLGNTDSILSVSMNARARYLKLGYEEEAARLLNPAISTYLDRGDIGKALAYIGIFEKAVGDSKDSTILSPFYYTKGRYYLLCNKIDSAASCFYKINLDVEKEGAYKGLLSVYQKKNNADSIYKYAALYANANDSCYMNVGQERIANIASMYRYGRFKAEAEKVASKLAGSERNVSIALFALVCLGAILYVYMVVSKKKRRKNIEKIKMLSRELNHTIRLLNSETNARAIEMKRYEELTNIMDHQDTKYNCELAALEKTICKKDEKIASLQNKIDMLDKEMASLESKEKLQAFLESEIYKIFKYASSHPNYSLSKDEWNTMESLFRNTFLKYYDFVFSSNSVSPDQMKVALLLRMGFAETEMAMLMDVDNVRINRIKTQLNKKLFNGNGAKTLRDNLREYF